ncbi:MAG: DUF4282 domain-containing protein [Oscillospiraceae bacterium]|nr:DUF4282 domain-containing protein [Oscillospiraceae bacterium]
MMFCTFCGGQIPNGAGDCPQCGRKFDPPAGSQEAETQKFDYTQPQQSPPAHPGSMDFGSFLSFDVMITPMIMKIIYIIGSVVIVLAALVAMFTGGVAGVFAGLIGGALGLVYFRVICEVMILFFKMHKDIKQVRENTERK